MTKKLSKSRFGSVNAFEFEEQGNSLGSVVNQWKLVENLDVRDNAVQSQVLSNMLHTLAWRKLDQTVDRFRKTNAS